MNNYYHKLREKSPASARTLVRSIYNNNSFNIKKTARILKISRNTVRRAIRGPLNDISKKPKNSPNKINPYLEELIVKEAKYTNFRYKRLHSHLLNKYGINVSPNTIKGVLKRKTIVKKYKYSATRKRIPLYDYEHLLPFQEMQVDTKHILDKTALPMYVYQHIKKYRLPLYEYNIIDAATRIRFTSYAYSLSSLFGLRFILFVVAWLRAHNVRHKIRIQGDNGAEFCSGSKRKEEDFNRQLKPLNAVFESIMPGKKYKQGIVENSHRIDDESFLIIHAERCFNAKQFIEKATRWQDTWNTARNHFGRNMNGKTPLQKLKSLRTNIFSHVVQFPVMLLENTLKHGKENLFFKVKGGQYVLDMHLL
jgi:transposase